MLCEDLRGKPGNGRALAVWLDSPRARKKPDRKVEIHTRPEATRARTVSQPKSSRVL